MNKAFRFLFAYLFLLNSVAFSAPNYNAPANTSTKTGFPIEIRENIADVAKMDLTTASNIPSGTLGSVPGALRYNRTSEMFEEYLSSTWTEVGFGPVGTIIAKFSSTAPTGYLILQGGTIGAAASGATLRANADTVTLYTQLWTDLSNTEAPVSSGRGASAAADFGAGKTLTLPDMRQRFPIGKAASGTGSTLGGTGGTIDHTHTGPSHDHTMGSHTHTMANHTHTIAHTHNMGNHTHSTPNHQHNAGNLRAQIGVNLADAATGIRMALDGVNSFTSGYKWSASGVTLIQNVRSGLSGGERHSSDCRNASGPIAEKLF
jgi:hypothetical protein